MKPSIRFASLLAGALGAMVTLMLLKHAAFASEIVGRADKIIDGDTLWICDRTACHKIRLCGINAPEISAPGGLEARKALKALVARKDIACIPVGDGTICDGRSKRTSYDRTVAQCFVRGADIAGAMVKAGHACDWVRFSGGHYSDLAGAQVCETSASYEEWCFPPAPLSESTHLA